MGFDLGDLLRLSKKVLPVAPMIGTLLGGQAGASVATMISSALGTEHENISAIEEALVNTPLAFEEIKKLEIQNKVELQKILLESERINLVDVQSARKREVDTAKITGRRDYTMASLAFVVVVGYFTTLGILMFVELPK